jgi:alpha/beta superfamily hydrolase
MTPVELVTADGERLEGRWDSAPAVRRGLVFCHPHPLQGGTMTAPLMTAVTTALVDEGFVVLRFNFRGVGHSTGTHGSGLHELEDVDSAVRYAAAQYPDVPFAIAGWSFGAATALNWQATSGSTWPYVGIAPPVVSDHSPALPSPAELAPASRTFILGDRDQFTTIDDLAAYARGIGAALEILKGSDHFFYFREEFLAQRVIQTRVSNASPVGLC